MGRFGHYVIDADGHGGEPLGWRRRMPKAHEAQLRAYVAAMKEKYKGLPGGGMQINAENPRAEARPDEGFEFDVPMRPGMYDPEPRMGRSGSSGSAGDQRACSPSPKALSVMRFRRLA